MPKVSENLVLPTAVGVYVALFSPRDPMPGSDATKKPRYQITLLYPKDKAEALLRPLMESAVKVADGKWPGKGLSIVKNMRYKVVRDGDADYPDDPTFRGMYYVKASTEADPKRRPPTVIDAHKNHVLDDEGAYSGCTFNVSVRLYPFDRSGNRGVGIGLNNVQVVKRGVRLDGRKAAEEEFSEVEGDDIGTPSGGGLI